MKKISWLELSAMLCSCCSSLLFGLSYMFTKNALNNCSVFSLLSWRFIIGGIAMTICMLLGIMKIDFRTKSPWPLLKMTVFMPAIYFVLETFGVDLTTASESGTIIASIPIITTVASAIFLKEKATKIQVLGVLISTAGIVTIVLLKGTSPTFNVIGYLCLFGAAFADVAYFIENRRLKQYNIFEKTYFMCLTGAAVFTLIAVIESSANGELLQYVTLPFHDSTFLISATYLGLGCTTLAFLIANRSVTILGPTRTSAFAGLSTVISIISGVVFLHDSFSLLQGIASVAVLVGIYFVNVLSQLIGNRQQ